MPHPVCVWARHQARGLPLHASSPLHLNPLNLGRLLSPGRRTPLVSPGLQCSLHGGSLGLKD